jgi:hypothetical protein
MNLRSALPVIVLLLSAGAAAAQGSGKSAAPGASLKMLKTRPERTNYAETSRYDDVMEFLRVVAAASPRVHTTTFGYSFEGRPLPLAVVGKVKDASPEAVKATGKTRIYIQGDIHAGEVEGKEACLEILRAIALGQHAAWVDSMVLLVGPIYNPDGNDRVNLTNRPGQNGPIGGMGQRATAQNYDLNRDFTKLDAPESRSLVRMLTLYDPHVAIDLHTTDGTAHAYHMTYAPPLHPSTAPGVIDLLRKELLPAVTKAIKAKDSWDIYYYGNLPFGRQGSGVERAWYTTDPTPRYSANYWGLRNRLGILSETFAYLTFEERIRVSRRFVEEVCGFVVQHGEEIRKVTADADRQSIVGQEIALLTKAVKSAEPVEILMGEVTAERNPYTGLMMRRRLEVQKPEKMYEYTSFEASETTRAPRAYLVPPTLRFVVDRLEVHGVRLSKLDQRTTIKMEQFRIASSTTVGREYQGHKARTITGQWEPAEQSIPAGTLVVPVEQPLGRLIVLLLEPRSEDGLAAWNLMDEVLEKEKPQIYPVLRTSESLSGAR